MLRNFELRYEFRERRDIFLRDIFLILPTLFVFLSKWNVRKKKSNQDL
jgi:hypothetical protein